MLYIIIVVAFVIMEHNFKNYIEENKKLGEEEEILNGKIIITKHHNKGAFLNLLEDKKEIVKTVSCICLGLIFLLFTFMLPKKGNKLFKLGLSLLLGGAISNIGDRIHRGYVVDYFSINNVKLKRVIFNLSDFAIFAGSFLLLLASLFSTKSKRSADETTK